jgi:hypothetical protein
MTTTTSSISTFSMSHEIIKCSISNQAKESRRKFHHLNRQRLITDAADKTTTIQGNLIPLIPNSASCDDEESWCRRQIPSAMSSSSFWFYFIATITLALCFLPTIASSQNISSHHHHHRHYYQLPTL